MIQREDILSIEFLKKTEFTGSHQGMRYRLEGISHDEGEKKLRCTVWPDPYNFYKTSDEKKQAAEFEFGENGITEAIAWMNNRLTEERERWEHAGEGWD